MSRIVVAVGVILNGSTVLLSKRLPHQHQGGLWEFPGGKVDAGETVQQALARELKEELAIEIEAASCQELCCIEHDYSDKKVRLEVYTIRSFSGTPHGVEQQAIAWVEQAKLKDLPFPAANQAIIDALYQLEARS